MSGFYIGVDGKARKIKGGYVGVDGVARKIKKGYIGMDGVARLCYSDISFDPVFANNTWEDVIVACQNNAVPDTWSVGDQLTMNIGGTDYLVDIIGKNHDDYADGSGKAPLTFQLHDCYRVNYQMNASGTNNGGWLNSDMRKIYLPIIMSSMPSEIQTAIKEVSKSTSAGNFSSSISITADKLFLLSEIEIFNTTNYTHPGEGNQYTYYTTGNHTVKFANNVESYWWERSPQKSSLYWYGIVNTGGSSTAHGADASHGVSFAFCF